MDASEDQGVAGPDGGCPAGSSGGQEHDPGSIPEESPHVLCLVMFGIDAGLCLLRVLFVALGLIGLATLGTADARFVPIVFEELTGAGIALCGLSAAALAFLKQPQAVPVGYANVGFTLAACAVSVWIGVVTVGLHTKTPAERVGFWIGIAGVIAIRLFFAGCYVAALVFYQRWLERRGAAA